MKTTVLRNVTLAGLLTLMLALPALAQPQPPAEVYRFARGEEVTSSSGQRAKLSRPLDFLVVADHAEMYGLMPQLL